MRTAHIVVVALLLVGLSAGIADAQIALRGGGGLIFEGKQIGGHVSLVLPFSSKPAGVMVAAEYYKESGVTTIPISARGLYRAPVGEKASLYLGLGTGFIYQKADAGGVSLSSTEALFSAVAGLNIKFSGPLGIFGEVTMDRAFVSGADSNLAAKAGISLTLSE